MSGGLLNQLEARAALVPTLRVGTHRPDAPRPRGAAGSSGRVAAHRRGASGRVCSHAERGNKNRGAVLIVVLVCFVVAASLFVLVARHAGVERRASETHLWTLQAQWVAEAAIERAVARLAADVNYQGETWTLSAADLAGDDGAKVVIHIEKAADRPDGRRIRVEAECPDDPVHRARWEKEIVADR